MSNLTVVKVGGGVLEDPRATEEFLTRFAAIAGYKVLVHGGGREATRMQERLGIPTLMVEGRRITDAETLKVVTMVYGGLINKQTVASLQSKRCNAIGLCGADAGLIRSVKRPVGEIDYGFVGDVERVDGQQIAKILELDMVPVFAPLTFDMMGNILNTNADTMASKIAVALSSYFRVNLVCCFDKPGVLSNPNDNSTVIPVISSDTYQQLKAEGMITDGMIPKLDNFFSTIKTGVSSVVITDISLGAGTRLTLG